MLKSLYKIFIVCSLIVGTFRFVYLDCFHITDYFNESDEIEVSDSVNLGLVRSLVNNITSRDSVELAKSFSFPFKADSYLWTLATNEEHIEGFADDNFQKEDFFEYFHNLLPTSMTEAFKNANLDSLSVGPVEIHEQPMVLPHYTCTCIWNISLQNNQFMMIKHTKSIETGSMQVIGEGNDTLIFVPNTPNYDRLVFFSFSHN